MTEDPNVPFSVRVGGRVPDRELWEGVPDWLLDPLLDWLEENVGTWQVKQLMIQLRLALPEEVRPDHSRGRETKRALRNALAERSKKSENGRWDILDAIDYICRSNPDLGLPGAIIPITNEPVAGSEPLTLLNGMLTRGGSAYRVRGGRLERRVDNSALAAFERAAGTASDDASMFLQRAWSSTYGRKPDPTRGYADAVRAVEAVACPLVLPNDPKPTLGKVISHLRQGASGWTLVLPGEGDAAGVEPLRLMLQLLWTAQRSRHAGGPDTREQLLTETEVAVSLAVTIVQWFANGFVQRAGGIAPT